MPVPLYDQLRQTRLARLGRIQILKLEPTAYRVGAILGPPPFRSLARARHCANQTDWPEAAAAWRRLTSLTSRTKPTWHYEYSICLDRLGEPEAASDQEYRALNHRTSNPFDYYRLAARAIQNDRDDVASFAYEQAAKHTTDLNQAAEANQRAADAAFKFGDWSRAEYLFERAIQAATEAQVSSPASHAGLVNALRKAGRLNEAEIAVGRARLEYPTSASVAAAAAWVATERRDWQAAAQRWPIAFANRRKGLPTPRSLFGYGEALEHLEEWSHATEVYGLALKRLEKVNASWAHAAALEWEYRQAYCAHRSGHRPRNEPEFQVKLSTSETREEINPAPGEQNDSFATDFTQLGLRIRGRVSDPAVAIVSVTIDDHLIKKIDVDHSRDVGFLTFTIRYSTLRFFPSRTQISVLAGERLLRNENGATVAEALCPFGDGSLFERLKSGEKFTKKGTLVSEALPHQLLDVYTQLRSFFAEQLKYDLFLMYGTLLGCYRDGEFIPGDDDIDVGFCTSCNDPTMLKAEAIRVTNELLAAGFNVTSRYNGTLFKVWIDGIDIDIYPIWFQAGRAWAYDAITATPDSFLPSKPLEMLGVEVLVPSDPVKILRCTYGADWQIPQPGFRHYRPKWVTNKIDLTALTRDETLQLLNTNLEARRTDQTTGTFGLYEGGDT